MYNLSARTKKSCRCREVAVSGDATVSSLASHADVLTKGFVTRSCTTNDVCGAGARDEPLRTSAWEAISSLAQRAFNYITSERPVCTKKLFFLNSVSIILFSTDHVII